MEVRNDSSTRHHVHEIYSEMLADEICHRLLHPAVHAIEGSGETSRSSGVHGKTIDSSPQDNPMLVCSLLLQFLGGILVMLTVAPAVFTGACLILSGVMLPKVFASPDSGGESSGQPLGLPAEEEE